MIITIIYDNSIYTCGLKPGWGFSVLIETKNTNPILFDTGANSQILLENMTHLNIDPQHISTVVISHMHWDHVNGLPGFLEKHNDVDVYLPASCKRKYDSRNNYYISEPARISNNIYLTGELENIEQSMALLTKEGVITIVGCSHPGVSNILAATGQFGIHYALIGGLHGFNSFDILKNLQYVCPTHCTQYQEKIHKLYPEKYIQGGVGKVIEFE